MPIYELLPIFRTEDGEMLDHVLVSIGAASPEEVELRPSTRNHSSSSLYRAICRDRWADVDRVLAIKLRESGAVWSGDLLRDPCAVA